MFRDRVKDRLKRWHMAMAGYRIYLLAFLLALPDILDGLVGFDYATILPEGWGAKAATWIAIARVVFGVYIRSLRGTVVRSPGTTPEEDEQLAKEEAKS